MRAIAFIVFCSCAPVVAPSSLPFVTIDRSLNGAICSREAAEVIVAKRIEALGNCTRALLDERTNTALAAAQRDEYKRIAASNSFWAQWGLPLLLGGVLLSLPVGFGIGFAVGNR